MNTQKEKSYEDKLAEISAQLKWLLGNLDADGNIDKSRKPPKDLFEEELLPDCWKSEKATDVPEEIEKGIQSFNNEKPQPEFEKVSEEIRKGIECFNLNN